MHKSGYGFPILLSLTEKRKENGERTFVGTIVETEKDSEEGTIVITEDGTIVMISRNVENMFGYKASEVIRTNVTIFMMDAYAANHESYLRRYRETGEARVIGTAGRNVPARRKDGTVFPASLTVEEEYVGLDRYFVANITDTTHLTATIFMDGYGIIQNCDKGLSTLLGYRKEDLIGKNIKGVMPPPYNECTRTYNSTYIL